jgi:hypothetical protein
MDEDGELHNLDDDDDEQFLGEYACIYVHAYMFI